MNFITSIKTCFSKWKTISGRASRAEFWWFYLFASLVSISISLAIGITVGTAIEILPLAVGAILYILIIFPYISVAVRRLHDTNHSGWYVVPAFLMALYLFAVVASDTANELLTYSTLFFLAVYILYSLMLFWWVVKKGDKKSNRYGKSPL